MKLPLLFLLATLASAQNALWLDLSGPWRSADGDDPRWSQPAFDDSAWKTVPVPNPAEYGSRLDRHFWLRRTVTLPPGTTAPLTVGAVAQAVEVYVNGSLIGSSGPFPRRSPRPCPRPHL